MTVICTQNNYGSTMSYNIVRKDGTMEHSSLRWSDPDEFKRQQRISYVKSILNTEPIHYCPECNSILESEVDVTYCTRCGLVTSASIEYVAGCKIVLPYGRK